MQMMDGRNMLNQVRAQRQALFDCFADLLAFVNS